MIKLHQLVTQSFAYRTMEGDDVESDKVGTLRAGNTGMVSPEGQVIGKCARLTHLRYLGYKVSEHDEATQFMFRYGNINEDVWMQILTDTWKGKILTESETPTNWTQAGGIEVTGRPDIVLLDPEDEHPVLGLELKAASSFWTWRSVRFLNMPKWDHMCQAGHYMWQLGVPFKLVYTNYVYHTAPWLDRMVPRPGQSGSEAVIYDEIIRKGFRKVEARKAMPGFVAYDIRWSPPQIGKVQYLEYRNEATPEADWTRTKITIDGIRKYFDIQSDVGTGRPLPPRPLSLKIDGSKESWVACDSCPIQDVCDTYEDSYDAWEAEIVSRLPTK